MKIGFTELLLILMVIFVLFGAGKLPTVMGDVGKGLRQLRKELSKTNENTEV